MSISSLRKYSNIANFIVAEDNKDPIKNKNKSVKYLMRKDSSEKLYGISNIKDMYEHFAFASCGADYLLKIDSDMLCLSSHCFERLNYLAPDAYGGFPNARPDMVPPKHFNGGAYFLKKEIAKKLRQQDMSEAIRQWDAFNMPEDMTTSCLVNRMTDNIIVEGNATSKIGKFHFDGFVSKVEGEEANSYGFVHCRTNTNLMRYYYGRQN